MCIRDSIYVLNEVKIDIVNYTYTWLDDVVYKDGIRFASPRAVSYTHLDVYKRQVVQFAK